MRSGAALLLSALAVGCASSAQTSGATDGGTATVDASQAVLLSLAVSPLTLNPTFSPSTHDYYVRCLAGANALTVTATATPGGTVALVEPIQSSPESSGTVSLDLAENQAIVVSVALGAATSEYWLRCLPHAFPQLAVRAHPLLGTPVPGYYLVGNTFFNAGELGYAMVLDGNGTPVWYGQTSDGSGATDVKLLKPSTIAFASVERNTFGTYGGQFELHALSPVGITSVTATGIPVDTHDLRHLANGDYLVFGAPVVTGVDLTGLGSYGANEDILNCVIQEVGPGGELVWQWTATDHFDLVRDSTWPQPQVATNLAGMTVTVVDPLHCNSLDEDANGNLLVSARSLDSIFLISKATGAIVWKMGGSSYTKDGARFIQVTGDPMGGFHRQHDARFQPDGTISLFDDETALPGPARALVVSYDVDAGTASIVWQYKGTASVGSMGSVTILADGSRVIGWGDGPPPAFSEVTEEGEDLLDVSLSDGDSSYRAIKIPASAVDIGTLRRAVR